MYDNSVMIFLENFLLSNVKFSKIGCARVKEVQLFASKRRHPMLIILVFFTVHRHETITLKNISKLPGTIATVCF